MKNKKILEVFIWGSLMILVSIICIIFNSLINNDSPKDAEAFTQEKISSIFYDGSEKNPYIEGVQ